MEHKISQLDIDYFNQRDRLTEIEARNNLLQTSNMVRHLCINEDGTFSIVSHIVCEYCDFCEEQGDCRGNYDAIPVKSKVNIYEVVGR